MPNLMEEWAMSSSAPRALRTYEGSRDEEVQADPEESATSFSAIRRLSPSTKANDKFTQPGYELKLSPLRTT